MDISSSDLQDLEQRVYRPDDHIVDKPDLLLGHFPLGEEVEQPVSAQQGILDPKAARVFEMYIRRGPRFTWENRRSRFMLLGWLIFNIFQKNMRRAFNLFIAFAGLPFVLPIMLFTAIAIKLDSPGPVIFRQERVGRWGRRFICYKFRSMYINAEAQKAKLMEMNEADEVVFKIKHDPRVTRVGRVIRKLSIDELPQIFNVIKGDMGIVGPRPPVPSEVEDYQFDTFRRLETIPGITGLQQVSGRSDLSFQRWVELDFEYIRDQSLRKDIEILLRTIPAVVSGKGAY